MPIMIRRGPTPAQPTGGANGPARTRHVANLVAVEGLVLRLSELDADAASAVRVIGFFDALIEQRASLDRLVASTARLTECPVGLHVPAIGVRVRADADGVPLPGPPRPTAGAGLTGGGRVWLERDGAATALDPLILERLAIAAGLLLEQNRHRLPELGDPALTELSVSASAGEAERSRALHLLGIDLDAPIRVLAVPGGHWPGPEPQAPLGSALAVLVAEDWQAPQGIAVGVGPRVTAIEAPRSWRAARTAARFAVPGQSEVVRWEDLGGLAVLADALGEPELSSVPDVLALRRLATEPGGADTLALLAGVVSTDSVRKAAALVHRHHSSAAARLARAETALGFSVHGPAGRFRLTLALALLRLRETAI
ncbi:helix-turn-helix domain-containing protein [Kutzneria albida]|uniref:helix-turn-helix domain-containing protein n=1 Tax=Kutzneria albida TaxID=43357 RepID=UPI001F1D8E1C|nr:helix-turn-helix domain-containing protein [Kutzneria albida]